MERIVEPAELSGVDASKKQDEGAGRTSKKEVADRYLKTMEDAQNTILQPDVEKPEAPDATTQRKVLVESHKARFCM